MHANLSYKQKKTPDQMRATEGRQIASSHAYLFIAELGNWDTANTSREACGCFQTWQASVKITLAKSLAPSKATTSVAQIHSVYATQALPPKHEFSGLAGVRPIVEGVKTHP